MSVLNFQQPTFAVDDLFSVAGRTVVVTGGGTGLGRGESRPMPFPPHPHANPLAAIATAYVQNGAKVFISGRRKEVLEATAKEILASAGGKGSITTIQGDVGTKAGCKKLFDDVSALTTVVSVARARRDGLEIRIGERSWGRLLTCPGGRARQLRRRDAHLQEPHH